MHCDEIATSAMASVFGITMNIVTCFYNYLILTHPLIVLLCYVFAYIMLLFYVYKLGNMMANMNMIEVPPDEIKVLLPDDMLKHKRKMRTNTQTRKSSPIRFQKGKYRHIPQGVQRRTKVTRRLPLW